MQRARTKERYCCGAALWEKKCAKNAEIHLPNAFAVELFTRKKRFNEFRQLRLMNYTDNKMKN